jgi:hypothetical protein
MKTFTVAALVLALLAMPAHAQARRSHDDGDKKADPKKLQEKQQADDKAYKAALERIPDSKEKYDPWGITKPAEPAKKPK